MPSQKVSNEKLDLKTKNSKEYEFEIHDKVQEHDSDYSEDDSEDGNE